MSNEVKIRVAYLWAVDWLLRACEEQTALNVANGVQLVV